MKKTILVLILILVGSWPSAFAAVDAVPVKESRCLFDENEDRVAGLGQNGGWLHDHDRILFNAYKSGFNCVVVVVWNGAGTIGWKSENPYVPQLASWLTRPFYVNGDPSTRDNPLSIFIEKAHRLGLEVHLWVKVSKRATNNIFLDNPEWVDDRVAGTFKGFNMNNSEFRSMILSIQKEVISRFDADGVFQDYERAGQSENVSLNLADLLDYMRNLNRMVRGVKGSDFLVSCYGMHEINLGSSSFYAQGRDIGKWGNEGLCDVFMGGYGNTVLPYTDNSATHRRYFSGRAVQIYPDRQAFLVNNYSTNTGASVSLNVDDFIFNVREAQGLSRVNGVHVYIYNLLTEEQMQALRGVPGKPGPFYRDAVPSWGK